MLKCQWGQVAPGADDCSPTSATQLMTGSVAPRREHRGQPGNLRESTAPVGLAVTTFQPAVSRFEGRSSLGERGAQEWPRVRRAGDRAVRTLRVSRVDPDAIKFSRGASGWRPERRGADTARRALRSSFERQDASRPCRGRARTRPRLAKRLQRRQASRVGAQAPVANPIDGCLMSAPWAGGGAHSLVGGRGGRVGDKDRLRPFRIERGRAQPGECIRRCRTRCEGVGAEAAPVRALKRLVAGAETGPPGFPGQGGQGPGALKIAARLGATRPAACVAQPVVHARGWGAH
jgi:hypothetical protein